MVYHFNLKHLADKDQVSGKLFIILAGFGIAGGVVVYKYQAGCLVRNGTGFYLTGIYVDAIQRPLKQVFGFNNRVLAIKIDDLQGIVTISKIFSLL